MTFLDGDPCFLHCVSPDRDCINCTDDPDVSSASVPSLVAHDGEVHVDHSIPHTSVLGLGGVHLASGAGGASSENSMHVGLLATKVTMDHQHAEPEKQ